SRRPGRPRAVDAPGARRGVRLPADDAAPRPALRQPRGGRRAGAVRGGRGRRVRGGRRRRLRDRLRADPGRPPRRRAGVRVPPRARPRLRREDATARAGEPTRVGPIGGEMIHRMNWMQVEEYLRRDDRAVLPLGSTEQHGYLSLAVDAILAERVAREAAEPLGVPVFPTVNYGLAPYFAAYPGTLSLRL